MSPLAVILVALVSISAVVAMMLSAAWHDLGRPEHARTWASAFAVTAATWFLPFTRAMDWLGDTTVAVLMPGLAGYAAVLFAIGFRQRGGLPPWRLRLFGAAFANTLALSVVAHLWPGPSWIIPYAALGAGAFALSARALRGRRRGERAAERVAEGGLAILTLLHLLVLAGVAGMEAGLLTLRLDRLAVATLMGLPGIIGGVGLFTIILLTADLADQTRRQAATDMLTGLLNRRGFEAAARQVLAAVRRDARQLALVLIDVDHFKSINDRFGHPAGDRVLAQVAQRIGQGIGRRDVFARVGGEEFALILADTDLQAAACAVEVLRLQVETTTFDLPEPTRITASFGMAAVDDEDEGLADLFLRADRALYRSKANGRNRVTVAA